MRNLVFILAIVCAALALPSCTTSTSASEGFGGCTTTVRPSADPTVNHTALQTALSNAEPGDVVCIGSGTYALQDQLVLATPNVEIRGSQAGRAVLDFSGQLRGPNGLWVIADGFLLDHVTVQNSAAAAIRIQQSKGITLEDVTVTWTNGPSPTNGGYGVYPTECSDVLMDHITVSYAEDAGVYIGQSNNVVIRNSEAFGNDIGIEFENTMVGEAYGNHMHDNVAGMLLSNLPNLPNHGNGQLLVHNNEMDHNNAASFASPGSVVSAVPSGAGVMVIASTDTDLNNNNIHDDESFGIGVFSFAISGRSDDLSDATYDQYPARTYIHDNQFNNNGTMPQNAAATLANFAHVTKVEDIVWDGELAPNTTATICLARNGSATYRNIDYADLTVHTTTDIAPVTCDGASVAPVPAFPPVAMAQPDPTQPHDVLSAYGFFQGNLADQQPAAGVTPYDVAVSLYADGAEKLRFIVLPAGGKITFDPTARWTFPDGTTLIKTFYFDKDPNNAAAGRTLIETRLEMLLSGTWTLQSYLWSADQTEATRVVTGTTVPMPTLGHDYRVPSAAECHICHLSDNQTVPLGPRTWQLNVTPAGSTNQLDSFAANGWFSGTVPKAATLEHLSDPQGSDSLDLRARSYLEANCAHCHSEGGTADATGLRLGFDITDQIALGECRSPVSAGPGSGQLLFDVVPGNAAQSIVPFRMNSTLPNVKMPQLPTTTADAAGAQLITDWINALTGTTCPTN